MSTTSSIDVIEDIEDEGWEVISTPSPKTSTIEIERKFIVPDNFHEKIIAQGYQMQKVYDEVLVDKYYDTHEHVLINNDYWLRQRNGDWELKYPVGSSHEQGSSVYHETTCLEEINNRISPFLPNCDLKKLLDNGKLKAFAHLETKRKNYTKEDVNIVIDATDWGHIVGEIEIVVTETNSIAEATQRIEKIAASLGNSLKQNLVNI